MLVKLREERRTPALVFWWSRCLQTNAILLVMEKHAGFSQRNRIVPEDVTLGQSDDQAKMWAFLPISRQHVVMLIADGGNIGRDRRMSSAREQIEEIIGSFTASYVITADMLGFVQNQKKS